MGNNETRLTCAEARQYDLVNYLATLGIEPKYVKRNVFWYLSPFRNEKTPSFKVDRGKNIWADFGDMEADLKGKKCSGGNLIDFGVRFHGCTVGEFLAKLEGRIDLPRLTPQERKAQAQEEANKVIILEDKSLSHPALLAYIKERRIPFRIADQYCREVVFKIGDGKPQFAIGFKNNFGGFELRRPRFKGSSSPKGFTTFVADPPASEISVFEGYFNFLSYMTYVPAGSVPKQDIMVLNSLVFFESARTILETYPQANLFLDRNGPGQRVTQKAIQSQPAIYQDKSLIYQGYEDFNDMICQFGRRVKNSNRLSP
ncbi:toprim domain-containing protein [Chitinophaga sp. Ak27]|uniref:toprim domain-containing protein n=1 Tax=Chitinophaga sp. Ak27 TaxID=2726116 RepID=UPI00145D6BB4|nr:toprim domain-containing protein [Chitinophaga sp. Ak27]NLU94896.1 DNA primase [Chitinophaga sp. Ak27]